MNGSLWQQWWLGLGSDDGDVDMEADKDDGQVVEYT